MNHKSKLKSDWIFKELKDHTFEWYIGIFFCNLHSLAPKIEVKVGRHFKKSKFLTVTLRDRAAVSGNILLWSFKMCYPLVWQTFQKSFLRYGLLQVGHKYEKIEKKSKFWQKLTSVSSCFIILAIATALKRLDISSKINVWQYHPGCSIQSVPQVGWDYWTLQNQWLVPNFGSHLDVLV